ncbi:hypothetical protein [Nocardia sp. NBC_00511]|uniref:hypothetical protein n=1 Tax=Nocardia sp. NBC_00511 TaxID=2903591 RepID=UPI0030E58018
MAVRLGCAIAAVIALVGIPMFGMHRLHQWQDRPVESVRIAQQVTVTGWDRLAAFAWSPGDDLPEGLAYFAGPQPYPDPVTAVQVPSIALRPVDRVQEAPDHSVQLALGSRPDHCSASVVANPDAKRYSFDHTAVAVQLTAARNAGKLVILVRVSGCPV